MTSTLTPTGPPATAPGTARAPVAPRRRGAVPVIVVFATSGALETADAVVGGLNGLRLLADSAWRRGDTRNGR
ncbi:hypothetical protein [Streptomyces morookaense]|uniref:Uncharacterized protein n=1 Tax=Streptomyces morookaense TaxID=1970 RepID=A0A7Y7B8F8_STRMO|nr:hypothetical protein [Streptomyces morookaense]NVK80945.1 hypothetical protein [Streptomyces morookaense]GHF40704.1 hypothetical protein GCM10010359_49130 [Streptomyces morookaense]